MNCTTLALRTAKLRAGYIMNPPIAAQTQAGNHDLDYLVGAGAEKDRGGRGNLRLGGVVEFCGLSRIHGAYYTLPTQ